jgi:D-hydroxyproline dehydrogenase subunit gamma
MREEAGREPGVERGDPLDLLVDGEAIRAYAGETVAGALTAAGRRLLRHAPRTGAPRGVFCGIGVCFECLVSIAGMGRVRSCMVLVQPGMRVSLRAADPETSGGGRAAD